MTTILERIAIERQRQITHEGWTMGHDDGHDKGELSRAAACYALAGLNLKSKPRWPWERSWWKPKDRIRNLERAAALIVAEIERLERLK